MLARSFVSQEDGTSKYLQKRAVASLAMTQQSNRQSAILDQALAQLEQINTNSKSADSYALRNLNGQKAARKITAEKDISSNEASERNLDDIKDKIKEDYDKANSPKDTNTDIIENKQEVSTHDTSSEIDAVELAEKTPQDSELIELDMVFTEQTIDIPDSPAIDVIV